MIRGWSDMVRFPRLGEIRLGEKDDNGIPKALDHFVVPPEVEEKYGEQPRELDIMFPHEEIDVVMPAALKRYGEQWGLICRGNGEVASLSHLYARKSPGDYGLRHESGRIIDGAGEVFPVLPGEDGRGWVQIPCQYKACPHYQAQRCREVVLVNVLLPKVAGVLGVYTIATGSFHSYTNIKNALGMLREMVRRISFVPLKLKVRMLDVHPEVGDKRIRRQVPVMYIDMAEMNLERMIELARSNQLALVVRSPLQRDALSVELEPANEDEAPELLYPGLAAGTGGGAQPAFGGEEPGLAPARTAPPASGNGRSALAPMCDGIDESQSPPAPPAAGESSPAAQQRSTNGRGTRRGRGQRQAGNGGTQGQRQDPAPAAGTGALEEPRTNGTADGGQDDLQIVRRLTAVLPVERLMAALSLICPFPDPTPDDAQQIVERFRAAGSEERDQFLRALAAQMIMQDARGVPAVLLQELRKRGLQPAGEEEYDLLLFDLDLAGLREISRVVRTAARAAGGSQPVGGAAAAAAHGAGGSQGSANPGEGTAGAEPDGGFWVQLKPTNRARLHDQDGRQVVSCQAMVVNGDGRLRQRLVVSVAADGQAGEALLGMPPGVDFRAKVRQLAATSLWASEVSSLAAVAS